MKIATAGSRTSKRWKTEEVTWTWLLDRLRTPKRTGETAAEYRAMSKDEQSARKDVGGFVGGALRGRVRRSGEVTERWLVTLDADDAGPDDWDQVSCLYDWTMAAYSTHSHTLEHPRLRWVVPLSRAVTPEEYPAVARKVAECIGIEAMDPSSYQCERLMYWPSCSEKAPYVFCEQSGTLLDPDELLASYGPDEAWRDSSLWPVSSKETEVVLREVRKQADPTTKRGVVGAFCRCYDVPSAIDAFDLPYEECAVPGRYTYAKGSTAAGAVLYDGGNYLYSNHATDPAGGQLCNAFDLVRVHKFGDLDTDSQARDTTRTPSYKAMCEFVGSLPEIKKQIVYDDFDDLAPERESYADTDERGPQDNPQVITKDAGEDEEQDEAAYNYTNWEERLEINQRTSELEPTIDNAYLILKCHPDFREKLGHNPMNDTVTIDGALPWWKKQKRKNEAQDILKKFGGTKAMTNNESQNIWTEGDFANFYRYMERFGFKTSGASNGVLDNALEIVSKENTFHPIRSYLADLKWDGEKRLETMFIRWLGAPDTPLDREITKLWMIAAVDRVMRPGCQFDQILITVGPQGIGKSKMLRLLSRGFFTNSVTALNMDKETAEKLQGVWIVELGELDGMKKGMQTAIKNFITSTTDRYRGAYARTAVTHLRQCVFAGTSNECSFLRDDTGERRYWIMPVKGIGDHGELVGFKEEVDQIWAEAVRLWAERMQDNLLPGQAIEDADLFLYLKDPKLEAAMQERRASYKMPEEDRDDIAEYLNTLRPDNWYSLPPDERVSFAQGHWIGDKASCRLQIDTITVKELRCELFGERITDTGVKSKTSYRIVDILDTMPGWTKLAEKKRVPGYPGGVVTTWVRIGSDADLLGR